MQIPHTSNTYLYGSTYSHSRLFCFITKVKDNTKYAVLLYLFKCYKILFVKYSQRNINKLVEKCKNEDILVEVNVEFLTNEEYDTTDSTFGFISFFGCSFISSKARIF